MGFFNLGGERAKSNQGKIIASLGCKLCPLRGLKNKTIGIAPSGGYTSLIYVLGGNPDSTDDSCAKPFINPEGQYFKNRALKIFSEFSIENDFRFNNVIRCAPNKDVKDIDKLEIDCCRKSIIEDIEKTKPLIIIGIGELPLEWLLNESNINGWRGRKIPVRVGNHVAWFFPILEAKDILYKKEYFTKEIRCIYDIDLKRINDFLFEATEPVIPDDYTAGVQVVEGLKEDDLLLIKRRLDYFKDKETTVDIETASDEEKNIKGFRPWDKGAKMLSIAIGTFDEVISFPVEHPKAWGGKKETYDKVKALIKDFLLNSKKKSVHNLKFELIWFNHYFGQEVLRETEWECTYSQAYVLDERKGMLNLDVLCLMHFGFRLKELSKSVDRKNTLKASLRDLLLYGGMDTKWTDALKKIQQNFLTLSGKGMVSRSDHHNKLAITLALTETKGLPVNKDLLKELSVCYEALEMNISFEIQKLPEVIKFEKTFGVGSFKHTSNSNLATIFRDILKLPSIKATSGKGYSTDDSVLQEFAKKGIKLATLVSEFREVSKLRSTYVDGIMDLVDADGRLRTNFNACFTSTSRLSSSNPNMQNFPKKKNKEIRSIICVPTKKWFVAVDYGQIQARCIGMASRDKKFCDSIWTGYDIHKEWAINILKMYPQVMGIASYEEASPEIVKKLRDRVKNQLVFPWFFLASSASVGRALNLPDTVVKNLYDDFWKDFKGVRDWQNALLASYAKNGYVESLTGRRRGGVLEQSMIVNAPIQAMEADIVGGGMNSLSEQAYLLGKDQYQAALNVHDDLSFILDDETLDEDIEFISKEMTKPVFDFINVPLSVEVSVGKDWCNLTEVGEFNSVDFGWMKRENYA